MPSTDTPSLARTGDALALAAWVAFAAAPLAYSGALGNAAQLAVVYAAVPLAVLACGTRLATGVPLALPAGGAWTTGTLVVFWGLTSRTWAEHPLFVGPASYAHLQALFILLIVPQLARGARAARVLVWVYLGAATAMAVGFLGVRALAADDWHAAHGFRWPGGNPNHTAMLLVPPALVAILLAFERLRDTARGAVSLPAAPRARWRAIAAVGAVAGLLVITIGASRSNGAALGLAVGLAALAWTRGSRRARLAAVTASAMGLAALAALAVPGVPGAIRDAVGAQRQALGASPGGVIDRVGGAVLDTAAGIERSIELRRLLAIQAIDAWARDARRVWVGVGIGGYLPATIPHRDDRYLAQGERAGSSLHPHNTLLFRLVEQGLVGLALYLVLLAVLARRALALARRTGTTGLVGAAGLASLAGLLAHGLVERFLDDPLGLCAWWGWAGIVASPWDEPPPRDEPRPWAGVAFGLAPAVALAVIYAGFVARPLAGRLDAREAWLLERDARGLRDPEARRAAFARAAALRAAAVGCIARVGEGEASLAERWRWAIACHEAGRSSEALDILGDLERRCPGYDTIEWNIASMAAYAGRFELARESFARYFGRCPTEPFAYEEWWSHRGRVADPAMTAWVLECIERGVAILREDDPRRAQLLVLQRRIALEGTR